MRESDSKICLDVNPPNMNIYIVAFWLLLPCAILKKNRNKKNFSCISHQPTSHISWWTRFTIYLTPHPSADQEELLTRLRPLRVLYVLSQAIGKNVLVRHVWIYIICFHHGANERCFRSRGDRESSIIAGANCCQHKKVKDILVLITRMWLNNTSHFYIWAPNVGLLSKDKITAIFILYIIVCSDVICVFSPYIGSFFLN